MRLFFFLCSFWTISLAVAQNIIGTWFYASLPRQGAGDMQEVQRTMRTFAADGLLCDTIYYDEHVLSTTGDTYVMTFRATIQGKWRWQGEHLLLDYSPRTLAVTYEGTSFPERDAQVQALLRAEIEDSMKIVISQQLAMMQRGLRRYYTDSPSRYLRSVSVEQGWLFVTTKEGKRAYRRRGAE